MKVTKPYSVLMALAAVILIAGVAIVLSQSGSGAPNSSTTKVSIPVEVQKQGPYAGLLSVAPGNSTVTSCAGCVSQMEFSLEFLNSGDDGMPFVNETAIRVTVSLLTPGFHLVNVTLLSPKISTNPVYVPGNGDVAILLYYSTPTINNSGPINLTFDAEGA